MYDVDYSAKVPLDFVVTYCNLYPTLELDRVYEYEHCGID